MQPILLLCVVLAVLGTFSKGERMAKQLSFGNSALAAIRGGAKGAKGKQSSALKRSKVSRRNDDDNDDDDDDNEENQEEDEEPRGRTQKSKSSNKGKSNRKQYVNKGRPSKSNKKSKGGMQLIPWATTSKSGSGGKKKKGNSIGFSIIKDRLEGIAKTGQAAYKDLYRKAKVLKSSAFEGILLKATWPGNEPVPSELLSEIVKYSIPSFKYARSDSEDDPYYMTLHKLWTKMCEKDWRTVTKSLYILHCISRDSSAEACANFATALKDLSKTRNAKKPDHKYFELRRLTSDLDDTSVAFDSFISAYGSYVVQRAKLFSGKFDELKSITESATEKKVLGLLKKAQTLIKAGMAVDVEKSNRNVIDGQAIRLVAMDLKELWQLYTEKLAPWLNKDGPKYAESKESAEDIKLILSFFKDNDSKVKEYLSTQSKAFSKLRVKIPSTLEEASTSVVTIESVNNRMEELLKLSGGASSNKKNVNSKKNPRRSIEEEEEEEEEEDGDDDDENYEEDDEEDEDYDDDENDDFEDEDDVDDEDDDDDDSVDEEHPDSNEDGDEDNSSLYEDEDDYDG